MASVRERLTETVNARAVCLRCGDLEGYDTLDKEIDRLLEDLFAELPRLPSVADGHTAPRPV